MRTGRRGIICPILTDQSVKKGRENDVHSLTCGIKSHCNILHLLHLVFRAGMGGGNRQKVIIMTPVSRSDRNVAHAFRANYTSADGSSESDAAAAGLTCLISGAPESS